MSYDLAIAAGPVSTIDTPPNGGSRSESAPIDVSQAPPPAPSATPLANPSLVLDPGLGLVVIEFRNNAGTVVNSIPSARQLEAYRANGVPSAGQDTHSPSRGCGEGSLPAAG